MSLSVDNTQLIKDLDLLDFRDADAMYFIQVLQRKKEHPELGSNSHIIKDYFVLNEKQYDRIIPEIKQLCHTFNARTGFWINRKSISRVAIETAQLLLEQIKHGNPHYAYRAYSKVVGRNTIDKKWLIDIDVINSQRYDVDLPAYLETIEPEGNKIIAKIPSRAGYHYITLPFNKQKFSKEYPDVDVHTNNFTTLYIP